MCLNMVNMHIVIWLFALFIFHAHGYEVCGNSIYNYKYCDDGYYCCSDYECCPDTLLNIGAIIGIVIGSIVFLSSCITVICCLVKKQQRPGQVIQPVHQPGVAVLAAGQHYGQPMYGQPLPGQPHPGQITGSVNTGAQ